MLRTPLAIVLLCAAVLQSGCALFMGPSHDQTSSVNVTQSALNYLYPGDTGESMPLAASTQLELPLRVGVAYVPGQGGYSATVHDATLETLAALLAQQDFIKRAVVLPPDNLTPGGGFEELTRLAHLYRVDAVVLLSYEQVVYTEDSALSLLDLTIVGAFVVPGHKNEVQTRLTATSVHVPSQRYLFSASTTHTTEQRASLVHSPTQIRQARDDSLIAATHEVAARLELALEAFKTDLESDDSIHIAGGSGGVLFLTLILICVAFARRRS